jgi:hypothetical protein
MPEIDNPYGVDAEMGRGRTLLNLIAEGFDGQQIGERYGVSPERAEELILIFVRRVLRGDAPPAPGAECSLSEFDGWCFKHGCHHPAPNTAPNPPAVN